MWARATLDAALASSSEAALTELRPRLELSSDLRIRPFPVRPHRLVSKNFF